MTLIVQVNYNVFVESPQHRARKVTVEPLSSRRHLHPLQRPPSSPPPSLSLGVAGCRRESRQIKLRVPLTDVRNRNGWTMPAARVQSSSQRSGALWIAIKRLACLKIRDECRKKTGIKFSLIRCAYYRLSPILRTRASIIFPSMKERLKETNAKRDSLPDADVNCQLLVQRAFDTHSFKLAKDSDTFQTWSFPTSRPSWVSWHRCTIRHSAKFISERKMISRARTALHDDEFGS